MKTAAYLIKCLTNLHVGIGGASYSVVDNCVQRDVTNGRPCIYSSSLKGALRQFFESSPNKGSLRIEDIFGGEGLQQTNQHAGKFTFFQANLLAYPLRDDNEPKGYKLASCSEWQRNIETLWTQIKGTSGLTLQPHVESHEDHGKLVEATKELPVIARNKLNNGESQNLWYEEVVPAGSCFVFFVSGPEEYFDEFDKELDGQLVQIGANGSVGYGFCTITKLS
ncbi:MAG: type III-B CRISPR module RAMP protein Cmr4 [Porphyromonadaceae bacterium]|nr:type III-B CRISPR module RAMP protein Cmr4 [Porphyromonadaceae bacterium]